jgi:peptide/nickel transport system permease protein
MARYILRRLVQAVFTVFGVMLITFLLFRVIAGDVSSNYVNQKLGAEAKNAFNERHKLDRPAILNFHRRIELVDRTSGTGIFFVRDSGASRAAKNFEFHLAPFQPETDKGGVTIVRESRLIYKLSGSTPLASLALKETGRSRAAPAAGNGGGALNIGLTDGTTLSIDMAHVATAGDLIAAIRNDPRNGGKLAVRITQWSFGQLFNSQFFWHLYENITFSGRSYATDQTLLQTVGEHARFSLAITVPAMALGLLLAMVLSCLVAYYRGGFLDKSIVFFSVLGMCVPTLAYVLLGQKLMFTIAPKYAAGLANPFTIFVPIVISVVSGIGASVRFYRVIILNEINKDYVRTARSKGISLGGILFKHVVKNCMLPILTEVITEIPFLIMGVMLLEKFFGIPGLGDLLLTCISSRDVPIITGLTFFTTILYVASLLVTDILYAVFDPRIRLR